MNLPRGSSSYSLVQPLQTTFITLNIITITRLCPSGCHLDNKSRDGSRHRRRIPNSRTIKNTIGRNQLESIPFDRKLNHNIHSILPWNFHRESYLAISMANHLRIACYWPCQHVTRNGCPVNKSIIYAISTLDEDRTAVAIWIYYPQSWVRVQPHSDRWRCRCATGIKVCMNGCTVMGYFNLCEMISR